MSTYAIGDVQGCYEPLCRLLDVLKFDPTDDELLFLGDLVNRGPDSLRVVQFVRGLNQEVSTVLGNHDLHFLALAMGARTMSPGDTLGPLLNSPDRNEIVAWLRSQPILVEKCGYLAVHAGVLPSWSVEDCQRYAAELEGMLQGPDWYEFLLHMYGNEPSQFSDDLRGLPRLRALTNVFTRLRFCSATGKLDLVLKDDASNAPPGMQPWFAHAHRKTSHARIVFGHWAALQGETHTPNVAALDTGCVWGGRLSALRLEDGRRFCCEC